ncbi:hypothetical protein Pcinc_040483 [Petrolisthes cinctipes]|uniref:Uncharacterized protein n=1 Tax=Petrolisthes cinctipes TaxID=88211 RepID=A0AAE1BLC6_PETCI|nr:hypothetical protein Pcinc_040483 [Petrolisthes cinctipes]
MPPITEDKAFPAAIVVIAATVTRRGGPGATIRPEKQEHSSGSYTPVRLHPAPHPSPFSLHPSPPLPIPAPPTAPPTLTCFPFPPITSSFPHTMPSVPP